MDFKLNDYGDGGELSLAGGDIVTDNGLGTAIYLSLCSGDNWYNIYTDQASDKTSDAFLELLHQPISKHHLQQIETVVQEALQWLITDRLIQELKVTAKYSALREQLLLNIYTIEANSLQQQYILSWQQQQLTLQ